MRLYILTANKKICDSATQITNAPLNVKYYAVSLDGSQLAWIGQEMHEQQSRFLIFCLRNGVNSKYGDDAPYTMGSII
jgi:hypothetical protein